MGPDQQEARVDDEGEECSEEEAEFPAVQEGEEDAETAGEDCADEECNFFADCVLDGADVPGNLRSQSAHICGVVPGDLLLEESLVVEFLETHTLGGAGVAPAVERQEG